MDGLSVAASVIGLITAAGQMTTLLYNLGAAVKDAPHLARAVVSELGDITSALTQLQNYLEGRAHASAQRLSLITVEHITATLTGCVMTYSELDVLLKSLNVESGMRTLDRAKWVLKKDQVDALVVRLQNHKISLSLMLNIMQCASQTQAEVSMDSLCTKVNEVLLSNQQLSVRLRNIEDAFTRRKSPAQIDGSESPRQEASPGSSDVAELPGSVPNDSDLQPVPPPGESQSKISAFEELLSRSRVYIEAEEGRSETSLVDDDRSTLAASIRSSRSLGEVSNISVYAIPVYAVDLSNSECYTFGKTGKEQFGSQVSQPSTKSPTSPREIERISPGRKAWWKRLGKGPEEQRIPPQPEAKIFGMSLQDTIRIANVAISLLNDQGESYIFGYVPIWAAKCGVFLKENASESELIFEKAGTPKNIQELQLVFDTPPRYGKGFQLTPYTVYDCGSVMLRYLLNLPEPVIPYQFYAPFTDPLRGHQALAVGRISGQYETVANTFDEVDVTKQYKALVTTLPPLSRQLLLYLLDTMALFASKSDLNLMTTQRLVAVFYQGILIHPEYRNDAQEIRPAQDVLIFLVEHQDSFLLGDD